MNESKAIQPLEWHPMRHNPMDYTGSDSPALVDHRGRSVAISWTNSDLLGTV